MLRPWDVASNDREATSMRNKVTVVEEIRPLFQRKKYENKAQKPSAMDSCFSLVGPHQHDLVT